MEECRQQHIKIDSKECAELSPWKAADYQEDVQRQGKNAVSIAEIYCKSCAYMLVVQNEARHIKGLPAARPDAGCL